MKNEVHKLMYSLWIKMTDPRYCWSCSSEITGEFKTYYFDHLLEKNTYPEFSLLPENLYFCCGECHNKKTNGFPTINHQKAINIFKRKFLHEQRSTSN